VPPTKYTVPLAVVGTVVAPEIIEFGSKKAGFAVAVGAEPVLPTRIWPVARAVPVRLLPEAPVYTTELLAMLVTATEVKEPRPGVELATDICIHRCPKSLTLDVRQHLLDHDSGKVCCKVKQKITQIN